MKPLNDCLNLKKDNPTYSNNSTNIITEQETIDNIQSSSQTPLQINTPSLLNSDSTTELIGFNQSLEYSNHEFDQNLYQKSPNRSISSTSDYSSSSGTTQTNVETKTPIEETQMVPVPVIQKPDGHIRVKILCLLGALLPGIGCYLCIAYTYLFQLDRVMNFTSISCDGLKR